LHPPYTRGVDLPFPSRFAWPTPGRDGALILGFVETPKKKARASLVAGIPKPFHSEVVWYGPLLYAYNHDMVTGDFRDTVTDVAAFDRTLGTWLRALHQKAPIRVAWGWSGRKKKQPPDAELARAWVALGDTLPDTYDQVLDHAYEDRLAEATKMLKADERKRAEALLHARRTRF